MSDQRTQLEETEDRLIDHLNSKLSDGTIGAIESKLLLDILSRREAEGRSHRAKTVLTSTNLPFDTLNRIVSEDK